jgi:caffeoyl-CoA O-methyltransferase
MKRFETTSAYAAHYTSPEPELLKQLNRDTHLKMCYPQMLSGHEQGRLLAMVSCLLSPKFILEIGTFTGYSALCLSEGLKTGGTVHTIEVNPEFEKRILEWLTKAGAKEKINLHIGDATEVLPVLLPKISFDLVFLDADKTAYPAYYTLLRKWLKPGAVILADNVLWGGKVLSEPVPSDKETRGIQQFNQMVAEDTGTEQVILPIRDGLSVIRVR